MSQIFLASPPGVWDISSPTTSLPCSGSTESQPLDLGEGPDSVLHEFYMNLYYRLLQDIEQSSLCYTVGPHRLSILCIVMCICWASLLAQTAENPPATWETWFSLWVGKTPWRRARHPTPVSLPAESHGQRSLVGCSPRGRTVWIC